MVRWAPTVVLDAPDTPSHYVMQFNIVSGVQSLHYSTRNSTVFSAEWKLCTFPQGTAPSAPSTQFTTGGSRQCRAVLVRRSTDPTHIYDLYFLTFTNREAPFSTTHPLYWALPFGGGVGGQISIWAMPKCRVFRRKWGFPHVSFS